jgi:hypothetical protein
MIDSPLQIKKSKKIGKKLLKCFWLPEQFGHSEIKKDDDDFVSSGTKIGHS